MNSNAGSETRIRADRPAGGPVDEPEDYSVDGRVIRFMWDYGVEIPLWDGGGLMCEEPEWLRKALGLSDQLVEDLRQWGVDMDQHVTTPRRIPELTNENLNVRGRHLADRLQQEVGPPFTVKYRPW